MRHAQRAPGTPETTTMTGTVIPTPNGLPADAGRADPVSHRHPHDPTDAVLRRRAVALRRLAAGLAQLAADADKSGLPDLARGVEALSPAVDRAVAQVTGALGRSPDGVTDPISVPVVETDEFGHPDRALPRSPLPTGDNGA